MKSIPKEEELYELADFFKMFGDTTRIKILHTLSVSEMCVCDLSELLNVSQSAVSHQLKTLRQMNLVKYRKEGKTAFYSLKDDHVKQIIDLGIEHIKE
jgi:ArsR family transcriptional regulator